MGHNSRLAVLEQQLRASQDGHIVVVRGGMPNSDPTDTEIAEAARLSKTEGGRAIVVGGLPEGANWLRQMEFSKVKHEAQGARGDVLVHPRKLATDARDCR